MIPIVAANLPELAALCRSYGVEKLELFGSASNGTFDPGRSDIDLIAWFTDKGPGYADRYLGFAESTERLLGRRVDVITPRSIGTDGHFRRSVDMNRMVIYEQRLADQAA